MHKTKYSFSLVLLLLLSLSLLFTHEEKGHVKRDSNTKTEPQIFFDCTAVFCAAQQPEYPVPFRSAGETTEATLDRLDVASFG